MADSDEKQPATVADGGGNSGATVPTKGRTTAAWDDMEKEDLIKLMKKQLMLLQKTKLKCDDVGSKNAALTSRLKEKDVECAQLKEKLQSIEEDQADDCQRISSLVAEKAKLNNQIKNLEEQLGCMQMKQETVLTTFQCLQSEVDNLQSENRDLKSEVTVLEQARDAALSSIKMLRDSLNAEHAKEVDQLQAKLAEAICAQSTDREGVAAEVDAKLAAAKQQLERMEAERDELVETLNDANRRYDASLETVSELEQQLAKCGADSTKVDAISESLAEMTLRYEHVSNQLATYDDKILNADKVQGELERLSNSLASVTERYEVAKSDVQSLEEQLQKSNVDSAEIVERLTESLSEATRRYKESKEGNSKLEERLQQYAVISTDNERLTNSLAEMTRMHEIARSEVTSYEAEMAKITQDSAFESRKLSDTLAETIQRYEAANLEVSLLQERLQNNANLESAEIERRTELLNEMTRRYEEVKNELSVLEDSQNKTSHLSAEVERLAESLSDMTRLHETACQEVAVNGERLKECHQKLADADELLNQVTKDRDAIAEELYEIKSEKSAINLSESNVALNNAETLVANWRTRYSEAVVAAKSLRTACLPTMTSSTIPDMEAGDKDGDELITIIAECGQAVTSLFDEVGKLKNLGDVATSEQFVELETRYRQSTEFVASLSSVLNVLESRVGALESNELKMTLQLAEVDAVDRLQPSIETFGSIERRDAESATGDLIITSDVLLDTSDLIESNDAVEKSTDCAVDTSDLIESMDTYVDTVGLIATADVNVQSWTESRDCAGDTSDLIETRDTLVDTVDFIETSDVNLQSSVELRDCADDTSDLMVTRDTHVDTRGLIMTHEVEVQTSSETLSEDATTSMDHIIEAVNRDDAYVQTEVFSTLSVDVSTKTEDRLLVDTGSQADAELPEVVTELPVANAEDFRQLSERHEAVLAHYSDTLSTLRSKWVLAVDGLRILAGSLARLETDVGCVGEGGDNVEVTSVSETEDVDDDDQRDIDDRLSEMVVELKRHSRSVLAGQTALGERLSRCVTQVALSTTEAEQRVSAVKLQAETAERTAAESEVMVNKYKNIAVKGKKESVELKKKVNELGAELQKTTAELGQQRALAEKLSSQSAAASKEKIAAEERCRAAEAKLSAERELSLRKASQSNVISLEIADYERLVHELNKKIGDGEVELQRVQSEVTHEMNRNKGLQTEIEQLEARVAQSESRADQLKELTVRQKTELADLRRTGGELRTAEGVLRVQLERAAQDVESYKFQVAEAVAEGERGRAAASIARDTGRRAIEALESRVTSLGEELTRVREEYDACQSDYENYKVRVHSVLKQQKSKLSPTASSGLGHSEDFGPMVKEQLENSVQVLRAKIQELSTKLGVTQGELESLQEEHNSVLRRNNKLVLSFNEQESSWRQRIEHLQRELLSEQREHGDTLQRLGAQQQQSLASSLQQHTERLRQEHQLELEAVRSQLAVAQDEAARLQREVAEARGNAGVAAGQSRDDDSVDIRNVERQDGEGSEFTDSLFGVSNKLTTSQNSGFVPLEQLLNQDDRTSDHDSFASADLEKMERRIDTCLKKIDHLTELLNESEATNAHLAEQARVLKEEIRRLERNQEREKHFANMEYLKNIVVKFLSLPAGDEREHLVPVITTILRLSPEEQQHVHNMAKGGDDSQMAAGWSSYLPKWPGGY